MRKQDITVVSDDDDAEKIKDTPQDKEQEENRIACNCRTTWSTDDDDLRGKRKWRRDKQSNTGTTTTVPVFISQQTLFRCRTNRGQDLVILIQRDQHLLTTTFKTKIDSQEVLKLEQKSFLRNSHNIPIPFFSGRTMSWLNHAGYTIYLLLNFCSIFLHFNTLIVFPSVWRNNFMIPSFISFEWFLLFLYFTHFHLILYLTWQPIKRTCKQLPFLIYFNWYF